MSEGKRDKQATQNELLANGVSRRSFLAYLAGAFATAALPDSLTGCSAPESLGSLGYPDDLSNTPLTWVTRKEDGLSLGFQFVNIVADANHNIAIAPGTAAGGAYIAITFPPQHVIEDALGPTDVFNPPATPPTNAYASGTSRIVFNVPATYGASGDAGIGVLPYTLQGVLELCALSSPVVAKNARSNPVSTSATLAVSALGAPMDDMIERKYRSLSQARIDRVIARVDERAAARVRKRAIRAARLLNRNIGKPVVPILPPRLASALPATAPAAGETSLELPFRILMSPDENVKWRFSQSPVVSPGTGVDSKRTELWHARPQHIDPNTLLPDGPLGQVTVRALWTRDYDIYGPSPLSPSADYSGEPVENENPSPVNRDAIVQNTGNMTVPGAPLPPLSVKHLMLSSLGGTIDLGAKFANTNLTSAHLAAWTQKTVLGRDEYVECVNVGTLLPFGHPAAIVSINKRAEDPSEGKVGALYAQSFLVIGQALVSYHDLPNEADYRGFPFVAVEFHQTKIPCAPIGAGSSGFAIDPVTKTNLALSATGTDYSGRAVHFTTPVYFCPDGLTSKAVSDWNGAGTGPGLYAMNRQRIAYVPPADGSGQNASTANYSTDGTSFETVSFDITVKSPSTGVSTPAALVPFASNLAIAVESFRHIQSTPAGTPGADATFNYAQPYLDDGFDPTTNPNEIFLTEANPGTGPVLSFIAPPAASAHTGLRPFDGTPQPPPANAGGLVAPGFAANAISRVSGTMAGNTAAGSSMFKPGFDATDYFGAKGQGSPTDGFLNKIQLFGVIPLGGLLGGIGDLASAIMPKSAAQQVSKVEQYLQKAVGLLGLILDLLGPDGQGTSGQIGQIVGQLSADLDEAANLAQGILPAADGTNARGPLTNAEMQAAAWAQSAMTQAQYMIQGYVDSIVAVGKDASAIYQNIADLEFDQLVDDTNTGSLQKFLTDLLTVVTEIEGLVSAIEGNGGGTPGPQSAVGAVMSYFGPVVNAISGPLKEVNGFFNAVGDVLKTVIQDLGYVAQGLEMARNLCIDFVWKPNISGYELGNILAFIPSTGRALKLEIKVNANSNNGPTGVTLTCRIDSFAICFGQGIPGTGTASAIPPGYSTVIKNADISAVFDHIQVQMLIGQKPDVDCVFKDIYFGGDLAFIETIKDLIPLDAFSDPPFVKVTTSGITAGFSLPIPNIAIGMFSMQNINITAALNIPWIAPDIAHGINLEFDFCTIDNPFVVTVSMLGGGGFFGIRLNMQGMARLQFGVSVGAQLAIDLTIASGCVSIEAGIFLVYTKDVLEKTDPVTGLDEVTGWVIGGYLRLRGELDILGIITISVELYLQIVYESGTGKCIASGYVKVDISLFFFSIHVKVAFTRTFAGANGDPSFAELMSPGGVDPMLDPTLLSSDPSTTWDPFAEYCMAYAA